MTVPALMYMINTTRAARMSSHRWDVAVWRFHSRVDGESAPPRTPSESPLAYLVCSWTELVLPWVSTTSRSSE